MSIELYLIGAIAGAGLLVIAWILTIKGLRHK